MYCVCRFGSRTAVQSVVNSKSSTSNSNNTNNRTEVRRRVVEAVRQVPLAARASHLVSWLSATSHHHPAATTTTITQTPVRQPVPHHHLSFLQHTIATPRPVATSNPSSVALRLPLCTTPVMRRSGALPPLTAAWTEAGTLAWVWVWVLVQEVVEVGAAQRRGRRRDQWRRRTAIRLLTRTTVPITPIWTIWGQQLLLCRTHNSTFR
jgi:hypothetical protein